MHIFICEIQVTMVRNYRRGNGKRQYATFSEEDLQLAMAAVGNGMAQAEASRRFNIPRGSLYAIDC